MHLYELTADYQTVMALLDDPETDLETVKDTLEAIEASIEDKAENIIKLARSLRAEAKAIKEEEERLKHRKTALSNKATGLEQYVEIQMNNAKLTKIKTKLFTMSMQNNPASVDIIDISKIPRQFVTRTIERIPDKKAIKAAIQAGQMVPGATLSTGKSLRIR